eukprot:583430-Hanusia_phi.AAC.1
MMGRRKIWRLRLLQKRKKVVVDQKPPAPPAPPAPPPQVWPPEGFEIITTSVEVEGTRAFGLRLGSDFPFVVQEIIRGSIADLSAALVLGDQLLALDAEPLEGKSLEQVRRLLRGRSAGRIELKLLRRKGVEPPGLDANLTHPFKPEEALRYMIRSLTSLFSDDGQDERCLITLKQEHDLLPGMFVSVFLGPVARRNSLHGVHEILHVTSSDSLIVRGSPPKECQDRDLTPTLLLHPCYLERVEAPFLSSSSSSSRRLPSPHEEPFMPYPGSQHDALLLDIPVPIRLLPSSARQFWHRHAPARKEHELFYPSLLWDDFLAALEEEAGGGEGSEEERAAGREEGRLFGEFDMSSANVSAFKAKLQELAGGELPRTTAGKSFVPAKVFARMVEESGSAVPAGSEVPKEEEEAEDDCILPAWITNFFPPKVLT